MTTTTATTATAAILADLLTGHEDEREFLAGVLAEDPGTDRATLVALRDAVRVERRSATIVLPAGRLEGLSRGRGWCRQGRGDAAVWGHRCAGGYRVGPGAWVVGATDGFSRQSRTDWIVSRLVVGGDVWTIAA